jgi:hypothetical protein
MGEDRSNRHAQPHYAGQAPAGACPREDRPEHFPWTNGRESAVPAQDAHRAR